jgi:predicted nucleic acid-binding protein
LSVYLDSSFLVSLYLTDAHSLKARHAIQGILPVTLTSLHLVEWIHALVQQEFRGNLSARESQQLNLDFSSDLTMGLWQKAGMPENAFETCVTLAQTHGPAIGVRTLDTLHVACALELGAQYLWTFDDRQAKLAKVVGLKTL